MINGVQKSIIIYFADSWKVDYADQKILLYSKLSYIIFSVETDLVIENIAYLCVLKYDIRMNLSEQTVLYLFI